MGKSSGRKSLLVIGRKRDRGSRVVSELTTDKIQTKDRDGNWETHQNLRVKEGKFYYLNITVSLLYGTHLFYRLEITQE